MTVLIRTRPTQKENTEIVYAYHANPDNLSEDERKNGVLVDSLPEKPSTEPGEATQLYYDSKAGECFYEVKDKKETGAAQNNKELTRFERQILERLDRIEQKLDEL